MKQTESLQQVSMPLLVGRNGQRTAPQREQDCSTSWKAHRPIEHKRKGGTGTGTDDAPTTDRSMRSIL